MRYTFRLTCVKLTTGLENFKGVVRDDLSLASVKSNKSYWWTLPQWKILCHRWSHDQPQPGSFFQRPREVEKRDPGKEVDFLKLKINISRTNASVCKW